MSVAVLMVTLVSVTTASAAEITLLTPTAVERVYVHGIPYKGWLYTPTGEVTVTIPEGATATFSREGRYAKFTVLDGIITNFHTLGVPGWYRVDDTTISCRVTEITLLTPTALNTVWAYGIPYKGWLNTSTGEVVVPIPEGATALFSRSGGGYVYVTAAGGIITGFSTASDPWHWYLVDDTTISCRTSTITVLTPPFADVWTVMPEVSGWKKLDTSTGIIEHAAANGERIYKLNVLDEAGTGGYAFLTVFDGVITGFESKSAPGYWCELDDWTISSETTITVQTPVDAEVWTRGPYGTSWSRLDTSTGVVQHSIPAGERGYQMVIRDEHGEIVAGGYATITIGDICDGTITTFDTHSAPGYWCQMDDTTISVDDVAPAVDAPDVSVEADELCQADVVIAYEVSDECDPDPAVTVSPAGPYPLGDTLVTVTATDAAGNSASDTMTVTVIDVTPPELTGLAADPDVLWPPNHKLIPITLTATATDNCAVAGITVLGVTSSEDPSLIGAGDTSLDDWVVNGGDVSVRAERTGWRRSGEQGQREGRVYTIEAVVADDAGNQSNGVKVTVTVPHDQR